LDAEGPACVLPSGLRGAPVSFRVMEPLTHRGWSARRVVAATWRRRSGKSSRRMSRY